MFCFYLYLVLKEVSLKEYYIMFLNIDCQRLQKMTSGSFVGGAGGSRTVGH